jgi:hypothetical protein
MESRELKNKINQVLDNMSDDVLDNVLRYLKLLTNRSRSGILLSQDLSLILEEDKNILERLAQLLILRVLSGFRMC